jgi:DNA adenine methylase
MKTAKPTRPILRYHGGKWILADWIISHFPEHRVYVEPFGGAASVLMQKDRSYAEVYNDLDGEVVNLFRVCRESPEELLTSIKLTPFSRIEFKGAYIPSDDPIEQARKTIVKSYMGFGSAAISQTTGFRSNSNRSGTTPAQDWRNFPKGLAMIIDRLQGVVIENRDAKEVMQAHDGVNTLHYVDPPYVLDTRHNGQKTTAYRFEMKNEEHEQLCLFLQSLKGYVILSGYDHPIYNELLQRWRIISRKALADGAKERTEVLWISPNVPIKQPGLFDG